MIDIKTWLEFQEITLQIMALFRNYPCVGELTSFISNGLQSDLDVLILVKFSHSRDMFDCSYQKKKCHL